MDENIENTENVASTEDKVKTVEKKKFDGGKIIVISILVLVTAAIFLSIGYFAGSAKDKKISKGTSSTTPVVSATAVKSASAVAAASVTTTANKNGTKTYTSEIHGYSFEYPQDWVVESVGTGSVGVYTAENAATKAKLEKEQAGTEAPFPSLFVYYYSDLATADGNDPPKYTALSDMVYDTDAGIYRDATATKFAGESGYTAVEGGMVDFFSYIIQKNDHIYKVQIPNKTKKSDLSSEQSNMLSSFKFTK